MGFRIFRVLRFVQRFLRRDFGFGPRFQMGAAKKGNLHLHSRQYLQGIHGDCDYPSQLCPRSGMRSSLFPLLLLLPLRLVLARDFRLWLPDRRRTEDLRRLDLFGTYGFHAVGQSHRYRVRAQISKQIDVNCGFIVFNPRNIISPRQS